MRALYYYVICLKSGAKLILFDCGIKKYDFIELRGVDGGLRNYK